ncbi:MAG: RNHCP domain-containing protein [Candidatus Helarchaeota archaeon]
MKINKKFFRKKEDFYCTNCGTYVIGDGYTNHCPNCLYSLHVDINPGDRASNCKGIMIPIKTEYKNDIFIITHKCLKCGHLSRIKSTDQDNQNLLIKLLPKINDD